MDLMHRILRIVDRSLIRDGFSGRLTAFQSVLACVPTVIAMTVIWLTGLDTHWLGYVVLVVGIGVTIVSMFWILCRGMAASARTRRSERIARGENFPRRFDKL